MSTIPEKKGHICPPSLAKHPSDRWESLFVYSFICKFTNLRGKIEGLETPMDFENALLSREPNPILTQLLGHFIINLRPQTRNLSTDQISTTVATVLSEYFKSSERTVFWNDDLRMNVDPFDGLEGGFFATDWDFKLKMLRQLVELQLCHTPAIKDTIDRAWGVSLNKHKKKDASTALPEPSDPKSQEKLQLVPLGQDCSRKRFWVADDSPRIYVSTNPWKITATFQTISSTREEYLATIDKLKASAPPETKAGERRSKLEQCHLALINALEARMEAIDTELARVQKVRKKIEQRNILLAQAEIRETRTRRQAQKPDYVYGNDFDSDDDAEEYTYQDDEGYDEYEDDEFFNFRSNESSRRRVSAPTERRRSTRTATLNANGKREAPSKTWSQWRGERRSSRLGAPPDTQFDVPSPKRARTEESTMSTNSVDAPSAAASSASQGAKNGSNIQPYSVAALEPTEIPLEQIAGKKKSKFWFYAVTVPNAPEGSSSTDCAPSELNGHKTNGNGNDVSIPSGPENGKGFDRSLDGSLSPLDSA